MISTKKISRHQLAIPNDELKNSNSRTNSNLPRRRHRLLLPDKARRELEWYPTPFRVTVLHAAASQGNRTMADIPGRNDKLKASHLPYMRTMLV
jgi:hypothetical protein